MCFSPRIEWKTCDRMNIDWGVWDEEKGYICFRLLWNAESVIQSPGLFFLSLFIEWLWTFKFILRSFFCIWFNILFYCCCVLLLLARVNLGKWIFVSVIMYNIFTFATVFFYITLWWAMRSRIYHRIDTYSGSTEVTATSQYRSTWWQRNTF